MNRAVIPCIFILLTVPLAAEAINFYNADEIKRLPPNAYKIPTELLTELQQQGCTIPQADLQGGPNNVIKGQFAKKGQTDWAALCSKEGFSSILIHWGGAANCPSEIGRAEDSGYLQGIGDGEVGFSRQIRVVNQKAILSYGRYNGDKLPAITHQGIEDAFLDKASGILYCHEGQWLGIAGAD